MSETDTAKLKVTFPGVPDLSRLLGKANDWIVDLAPDYAWAVVTTRFRTPVWILSRTPTLPEETLVGIKSRLQSVGFKTERLSPTLQDGCTVSRAAPSGSRNCELISRASPPNPSKLQNNI